MLNLFVHFIVVIVNVSRIVIVKIKKRRSRRVILRNKIRRRNITGLPQKTLEACPRGRLYRRSRKRKRAKIL